MVSVRRSCEIPGGGRSYAARPRVERPAASARLGARCLNCPPALSAWAGAGGSRTGGARSAPDVTRADRRSAQVNLCPHAGVRDAVASAASPRVRLPHRSGKVQTVRSARACEKPGRFMEPAGVEPASANRSLSASTCVFRCSCLAPPSAGGQPLGSQPRCFSPVRAEAARTCQPDLIDAADHASGRARSETGCEKAKPYAASAMLELALVNFAAD